MGSSGSTWQAFTLSSHSPANAASMAIFLTEEAGAGQVVYFDGVRLKIPGLVGKYDFTGKKTDDESGLTYFGARFYDAEVGRFVTADPKMDSFKLPIPQSQNRFIYCLDNPVISTDSKGLGVDVNGSDDDKSELVNDIEKATGYKTEVKDGKLSILGERDPNKGNAKAAEVLKEAIEAKEVITINLVNGKADVNFDSYVTNEFDLADFKATLGKSVDFGAACFAHMVDERLYAAQHNLGKSKADFDQAHNHALGVEAFVIGKGAVGRFDYTANNWTVFGYYDEKNNVVAQYEIFIGNDRSWH